MIILAIILLGIGVLFLSIAVICQVMSLRVMDDRLRAIERQSQPARRVL